MLQSVNPIFMTVLPTTTKTGFVTTNATQLVQTTPGLVANTQVVVPQYQSAHIYNTLTPSVVYEPRLAGPVYQQQIPVLGYTRPINCEQWCLTAEEKERSINRDIDRRVREQINRYNLESEKIAAATCATLCDKSVEIIAPMTGCSVPVKECKATILPTVPIIDQCFEKMKRLSCNDKPVLVEQVCYENEKPVLVEEVFCPEPLPPQEILEVCRKCPYEGQKLLNLDEKIQRIRQELNLPDEKCSNKLVAKLDREKQSRESMGFFTDDRSECAHDLVLANTRRRRSRSRRGSADSGCDRHRARSRSFDERQAFAKEELRRMRSFSRSCSRSRSRGGSAKPIWMPSGSNEYEKTREKRSKMIMQQEHRQYMLDSLDTINRNAVFNKPARPQLPPIDKHNKSDIYALATFAPVEEMNYSKPTESSNRKSQAYDTYQLRATYAPVPQEKPRQSASVRYSADYYYPQAETTYVYQKPKANTLNCYDLRPVQATKGGGIYSCSNNNELHYISDKARNTVQICTSNNNYSRNADNRTRIIKSDTTVIHD